MELKDLVGLHELTGVELYATPAKEEWYSSEPSCETISFVLDGKTYTAIEDPSDGYRSNMRDIVEGDFQVKNTFSPVKVMCSMHEAAPDDYARENDCLEMMDVVSGKIVLRVGTMNTDDYYPWWVGEWSPQHLAVNSQSSGGEKP
jgi:hypothetical protein